MRFIFRKVAFLVVAFLFIGNMYSQTSINPLADVCWNSTSFILTNGAPAGGTYSGPGVFSNRFYPSSAGVGTHTITYTQAGVSASTTITVNPSPNALIYVDYTYCSDTSFTPNLRNCYNYDWFDVQQGYQSWGPINVCTGAINTYSVDPGTGYTYTWTVNGGVVSSGQGTNNPTVTWGAPAVGSIKVVVRNSFGCVDSSEICVSIKPAPIANFTANNACLGVPTQFTNNSTGAVSYRWDFGDGTSSTQTNPAHTYAAGGAYSATLTAINACGCESKYVQAVNVNNLPGAKIICPSTVCYGDTVTYYTESSCGTYNWAAAGGTIVSGQGTDRVLVRWGNGPSGTLTLNFSGCTPAHCTTPTTITIPIIQPGPTITGPTVVCDWEVANYTMPSWPGAVYSWSVIPANSGVVIDGQNTNNVRIQWMNGATNPNAQLVVNIGSPFLGCVVPASLNVQVKPYFYLNGNSFVCKGSTSTFTATPGSAFNWTVTGTGNTVSSGQGTNIAGITWGGVSGTYTLSVSPTVPGNYCNSVQTRLIYLREVLPLDSIQGPPLICPGGTYVYRAWITPNIGGQYNWSVVGGTLSATTGIQVSVTWDPTGPYSITATHSYQGCTSTPITLNVNSILAIPPVITGTNTTCAANNQNFVYSVPNLANSAGGGVSYTWSINPSTAGNIVGGQGTRQVTIRYNTGGVGTATVNLRISVCSSIINVNMPVTILPSPNTTISTQNLCPDSFITIASTGVFPAYLWSNGATTQSTIISTPGVHALTITDANGCTQRVTTNIPLRRKPKSAITTDNFRLFCIGTPVNITLTAPIGQGFSFHWYRNGSSTGVTTSSIVATTPDSFAVVVTNAWGCTNTSKIKIDTVPCGAGGGPGGGPPGGGLPGAGAGAGGAGGAGGGGAGGGAGGSGFIIKGGGGSPGGISALGGPGGITGGQLPMIQAQEICSRHVQFTDQSPPTPVAWWWNFGDPISGLADTSNRQNPLHTYSAAGYYLVTLWAQYPSGAWVWDTLQIVIPAWPEWDWAASCPSRVTFYDLSTHAPGIPITSWNWAFGDGNTSTARNPVHNYASGGVYSVTLTITAGSCTVHRYYNVNVPNTPTADFSFPNVACAGTPTQFTDLSVGGGAPVTAWQWTFGDGASSNLQNPLRTYAPGNYNVTLRVTNANGCTAQISKTLSIGFTTTTGTITANKPINANNQIIFCDGDSVTLTAPNADSWAWSNGATTQSITVGTPATYAVNTYSTGICLSSVSPVTVIVRPLPTFSMSPVNPILCAGSSTYLYASYTTGGASYRWYDSSGPIPNNQGGNSSGRSFNAPGTYTLVATLNGCTYSQINTISPVPMPSVNVLGPNSLCPGERATLTASVSGGTAPYQYYWWYGQTSQTINIFTGDNYGLSVRDSNNCWTSGDIDVLNEPGPDLTWFPVGCYTRCEEESISAPPGYAAYRWFFNGTLFDSTSQNLTLTQSGIYKIELITPAGCRATSEELSLTIVPNPVADAGLDTMICPGDQAFLRGSGGIVYTWLPGGSLSSTTISNPIATPPGTTGYELEVMDKYGCKDKDTVVVTVYCNLPVLITTGDSVCPGVCGNISASISPGTGHPPYTFTWSGGQTGPGPHNVCPSITTTYTVAVRDSMGFLGADTVTVFVHPAMTLTMTAQDALCNGDNNGAAAVSVSGGTAGYTYLWNPTGAITAATSNTLSPGTYSVLVTDSKGCTLTDSVVVSEPPILDVSVVAVGATCQLNNGSATASSVGGTAPYNYAWSNGANTATASLLNSGVYTVTVTDANGCTDSTSVTITDTELPVATFTADDTIGCAPLCVTFTNTSPGTTAAWDFGDGSTGTGSPVTHCYTIAGAYSVGLVVTDANGCTAILDKLNYIIVHPVPTAAFSAKPNPTTILNPVITFTNQSSGATSYAWDFGDGTVATEIHPIHTYEDTGRYVTSLIVENEFGCKDSAELVIIVGPDYTIYIPNAFTPNGDDHNNFFIPVFTGIESYEMWIYDRWGMLIWQGDNLVGWDGRVQGKSEVVQQDVYVWVVKAVDVFGKKHKLVGHVTVVR